jgi:hypothetical protein
MPALLTLARRPAPADDLRDRLPSLTLLNVDVARPRRWWRPARSTDDVVLPDPSPEVAAALARLPTGRWRIRGRTAAALAALNEAVSPARVLEFGSGVSTVVFALLAARRGDGSKIVSLEESEAHAGRTRALIESFGVGDYAAIVVAPIGRRPIDGWTGFMYRPAPGAVERALHGRSIDFVFVDGPATWLARRGDCRFGTLLAARPWLAKTALFAADDCLRRGDLDILRRWAREPDIDVLGVLPVGSGLGLGVLHGP